MKYLYSASIVNGRMLLASSAGLGLLPVATIPTGFPRPLMQKLSSHWWSAVDDISKKHGFEINLDLELSIPERTSYLSNAHRF